MKAKLLALFLVVISAVGYGQGKYGATPEDSTNCIKNLSLYQEFFKQKNYEDAKGPWMEAMKTCPKSSKNLYIKGATMYKTFIKKEKDKAAKAELVKTLMWVYDQRIENFGQKGYTLGRKGSDLFVYGGKTKREEAFAILKESIDLQKEKTEAGVLALYYKAADKLVKMKKLEKSEMIALFPSLMDIVEPNLKKAKESGKEKKIKRWESTKAAIEGIFNPYASCDELIKIYQPKFDANKQDIATLKQIINIFEKRKCTDKELFLNASKELHKIEPSGLSALGIGVSLLKKERASESLQYFKQIEEIGENDEQKLKGFKYAATAALQTKQYATTKSYALKMLKIDPKNADAYMLIGDAYFYGSKTCGENDCMKNGGYWAAIPKYIRAKSLNPELAGKVGKKIAAVNAQLPKKEDCFFYNITNGQTLTIGCWINETVTVKTK